MAEARRLSDGMKVAIKQMNDAFENAETVKMLLRELVILRMLNGHGAITALIDILPPQDYNNFDCLYLIFEFVDTDLRSIIDSRQNLRCEYIIYTLTMKINCKIVF